MEQRDDRDEHVAPDRDCPACGEQMAPIELRSGEIAYRCPECRQIGI